MKTSDIVGHAFRLVRVHWARNLVVFFGIFLSSFLLALFFSFSEGLRRHILLPLEKNLQSEVLIITPKPVIENGSFYPLSFFQSPRKDIPREIISELKSWPEIETLTEEIRIPFPVAAKAQVVLGLDFYFDSTLSGFSEEAVQKFLSPGQTFSGDEEVIPVLLSPLLVEIYNSTIVEIVEQAERKTLEDFLQRSMEFTFGKINYLNILYDFPSDTVPRTRKAKVVGFAPFLNPFTFGIPEKVAREMREEYENLKPEEILPRALLATPKFLEQIPNLKTKLSEHGFLAKDLSQSLDTVRSLFGGLKGLLIVTATIILLLSLAFFLATLTMSVLEQRRSIGILRALGTAKRQIQGIFIWQGFFVAVPAFVFGFLGALLLATTLDALLVSHFPVFAIPLTSIFFFDPLFFGKLFLIFVVVVCSAAFFPARQATKKELSVVML